MSLAENEHSDSDLVSEISATLQARRLQATVHWREPSLYQVHLATRSLESRSEQLAAVADLAYVEIVVESLGLSTEEIRDRCSIALGAVTAGWTSADVTYVDDAVLTIRLQIIHGGRPTSIRIRTTSQHEYADGGEPTRWRSGKKLVTGENPSMPMSSELLGIFAELEYVFAAELEPQAAVDEFRKILAGPRIEIFDGRTRRLILEGLKLHDYAPISECDVDFNAFDAYVDGRKVDTHYGTLRLKQGQVIEIFGEVGGSPPSEWSRNPTRFYSRGLNQALVRRQSSGSAYTGETTAAAERESAEEIFVAANVAVDGSTSAISESRVDAVCPAAQEVKNPAQLKQDLRSRRVSLDAARYRQRFGVDVEFEDCCGVPPNGHGFLHVADGHEPRLTVHFATCHKVSSSTKSARVESVARSQEHDVVRESRSLAPEPPVAIEQEVIEVTTDERQTPGRSTAASGVPSAEDRRGVRERLLRQRIDLPAWLEGRLIRLPSCCADLGIGEPAVFGSNLKRGSPAQKVNIHRADCSNIMAVSATIRPGQIVEVVWRSEHSERFVLTPEMSNRTVRIAGCCEPEFGAKVVGYDNFSRGVPIGQVTVHQAGCAELEAISHRTEQLVEIIWRREPSRSDLRSLELQADNAADVKERISAVLASFDVNFRSWTTGPVLRFAVDVKDSELIKRIVKELKRCKGFISAKGLASLSLGHA